MLGLWFTHESILSVSSKGWEYLGNGILFTKFICLLDGDTCWILGKSHSGSFMLSLGALFSFALSVPVRATFPS